MLAFIKAGQLRMSIQRTYPLDEVAAALQVSRRGHQSGKLVLPPS
ncbi:zinc-binding dehydrogenase [Streptomyces scopuliridis]